MLRLLFIWIQLMLALSLSAQHRFSKFYNNDLYGNRISDQGKDFIQLPDSGFLFPTISINSFSVDTLGYAKTYLQVIRVDKKGDTVFRRLYYRKHHTFTVTKIAQHDERHFILLGHTFDLLKYDKDSIGSNLVIIKINDSGDTIWTKQASIGDGDELVSDFIRTRDGGYAVFGQVCDKQESNCDYYLIKLDSNGNKLWHNTYSYTSSSWELPMAMQETLHGDFLLAGYTDGVNIGYLVKTDSIGNRLWQKKIDSKQGYPVYALTDVKLGESNTYLVAGVAGVSIGSTGEINACGYFVRLDTAGNFIDEKQFGNPDRYTALKYIYERQGVIYFAGETSEYLPQDEMKYQTCLYAINSTSNETLWRRVYADSLRANSRYLIYKMKPTLDNGFAMIGFGRDPKDSLTDNGQDVWLLKVDSNGCLYDSCVNLAVGMELTNVEAETKPVIYPNPTERYLWISSTEPLLSIVLYNSIGQVVKEIKRPSDNKIDLEDLQSGIYLLQIQMSNGKFYLEKIVVAQ